MDFIKGCLFSMGLGIIVGAVLTASNKKFETTVKQAKNMAEEKLEEAKDSIEKIKKNIKSEKKNSQNKNTAKA